MGDTGLLFSLAFSENEIINQNIYKKIFHDQLSINKGMIYENIISQMLASKNIRLYFYNHYSKDKHINDIEIDFLISNKKKVFPIEVKSSKNYTTISYGKFKQKFKEKIGISYIVHPKQFQINSNEIKMPPYMLPFINLYE